LLRDSSSLSERGGAGAAAVILKGETALVKNSLNGDQRNRAHSTRGQQGALEREREGEGRRVYACEM
jgi:hypothetical protein